MSTQPVAAEPATWAEKDFTERVRIATNAYVMQGLDYPAAAYVFHALKLALLVAGWVWWVFTGDIHQIDQPYLDDSSNGLSYLISRLMGHEIYAHITLVKGERSALADLASDLL